LNLGRLKPLLQYCYQHPENETLGSSSSIMAMATALRCNTGPLALSK
jgi:hypothetical protein